MQLSDPTIVALEDMNIKSSMKQSPQFSFKSSCPLPYQRITLRTYSAWPIRAVWQKYLSDKDLDLVRTLLPKLILDFRVERRRKRADIGKSGLDSFCSDGAPGSPINHSARHMSCTPGVPACYWIVNITADCPTT